MSVAIGERAASEGIPDENLRAWLAQMELAHWRSEFDGAPAELADLLQFVRNRAVKIGQPLLDGATVQVPCAFDDGLPIGQELSVAYLLGEGAPQPLVVVNEDGGVVGQLKTSVHHDVSNVGRRQVSSCSASSSRPTAVEQSACGSATSRQIGVG